MNAGLVPVPVATPLPMPVPIPVPGTKLDPLPGMGYGACSGDADATGIEGLEIEVDEFDRSSSETAELAKEGTAELIKERTAATSEEFDAEDEAVTEVVNRGAEVASGAFDERNEGSEAESTLVDWS
jgi:hypothetical protein